MNNNDKIVFAKIMMGMADNFRDKISKEGMSMRFEMLKKYTIDEITGAAKNIMARRKYTKLPPIAEFIEELEGDNSAEKRATMLANRIIAHLNTRGAAMFPAFLQEDPTAYELMTTKWSYGNWGREHKTSDDHWWIKDFIEAYVSYVSTGHTLLPAPENLKKITQKIGRGYDQTLFRN